ncbi:protein turtle homolog A-like isoform X1 [Tachypleus tridentatus]|uniref:protein turtle homolog A-like isoform X1 n=1 Tax=Tachypleus tridentatus TaxID=6853 RepID=UPI003FD01439
MIFKKSCRVLAWFICLWAFITGYSRKEEFHTITALLGEDVTLPCAFEFPDGTKVPYIISWKRENEKIPFYIWYEGYPPHVSENYRGRVSLLEPASLNLTNVQESDQGWLLCAVFFLNRSPDMPYNTSKIHLKVHAPPQFIQKPPDVVYVKVGESLNLSCAATGTPEPVITWFKDNQGLKESGRIQVLPTKLRITRLQESDLGDYLCSARNKEGNINVASKVIGAGRASITVPPRNTTKVAGHKAEFICEAKALPTNLTHHWLHNGIDISELPLLEARTLVRRDGTLFINPTSPEDSGNYTCVVSNGIGEPESAFAFLNVEYAARVEHSPSPQYLPLENSGIIICGVKSNPPFQFVTWTKDRKPYPVDEHPGVTNLSNGSLLIQRVSHAHQGMYRCTPYNIHGTAGTSSQMEVFVRKPPMFTIKPKGIYQTLLGAEITIPCDGTGQPKPIILWRRADGGRLPRERSSRQGGNLTIHNLHKEDHGRYECVLENDVATLVTSTMIVIEVDISGTTPHPPTNVTVNTSASAATLSWLPAYDGGYTQSYVIWYRIASHGENPWRTMSVPDGATTFTLYRLDPETVYEFRVQSRNALGDGMFSTTVKAETSSTTAQAPTNVTVVTSASSAMLSWLPANDGGNTRSYMIWYRTANQPWSKMDVPKGATSFTVYQLQSETDYEFKVQSRNALGEGMFSSTIKAKTTSPKPFPPENVVVKKLSDGVFISWKPPFNQTIPVAFYYVEYHTESEPWKHWGPFKEKTSYLAKKIPAGEYKFRVSAYSDKGVSSFSPEISLNIEGISPEVTKSRAITAGVVGGILFFIAAIVLSVCAVKICNKRKRRKAEKAYMMVTCPVADARNGGHSHGGSPSPMKNTRQPPYTRSSKIRVPSLILSALQRLSSSFSYLLSSGQNFTLGVTTTTSPGTDFSSQEWSQMVVQKQKHNQFSKAMSYNDKVQYPRPSGRINGTTEGNFELQDGEDDEGGFLRTARDAHVLTPSRSRASILSNTSRQSSHTQPHTLPAHMTVQSKRSLSPRSIVSFNSTSQLIPAIYSPRDPGFCTSSPGFTTTGNITLPEDLSSVKQPSSAEKSFLSTVTSLNSHQYPAYELPSLHLLHEAQSRIPATQFRPIYRPEQFSNLEVNPSSEESMLMTPKTLSEFNFPRRPQIKGRETGFGGDEHHKHLVGFNPHIVLPNLNIHQVYNSQAYQTYPKHLAAQRLADVTRNTISFGQRLEERTATSDSISQDRKTASVLPPLNSNNKFQGSKNRGIVSEEQQENSDTSSNDHPMTYTRERLLGTVEKVRSGGLHRNMSPEILREKRDPTAIAISITPSLKENTRINFQSQISSVEPVNQSKNSIQEGEMVRSYSRASIASGSSGHISTGKENKSASTVHFRRHSLQDELQAKENSLHFFTSLGYRTGSNSMHSVPGAANSARHTFSNRNPSTSVLDELEVNLDSPHSEPVFPSPAPLGMSVNPNSESHNINPLKLQFLKKVQDYSDSHSNNSPHHSAPDRGL